MSDLYIVRIGNAVEITDSLYITVVSILPGADTDQRIPRLNHIAYWLRLLLGLLLRLYFSDGWPLCGNLLLGIGVFLCVRIQRFLSLAFAVFL